jgi:hypothetical protein
MMMFPKKYSINNRIVKRGPQNGTIKPCMGTIFYEDGLDNMKSDGIIV